MSWQTNEAEPHGGEPGTDIALVGMAGRFPGADGVEALWHNIRAGKDTITRFTEEELRAEGVPEALLRDPAYVRAGSVLDGVELFDAGFFGYTPKEAQLLDPQHRLFLESAWHALEDAGTDPARFDGTIGVVAGTGISWYLLNNLNTRPDIAASVGETQVGLANDKDSLATRAAYALDLTGPCYTVQSYCSTSLVAVSLACTALVSGEADMMLAGGASVFLPHRVGYLYQEAGMSSPDGRCRAFDASARGTPVGSGVGVVALRRLADAVADGDRIYGVIRGWAVTNDGADKVGFTAPGVRGQAAVMAEALASAGLAPADIDYVEAHGTATHLGDAIEITALQRVFDVDGVTRCAIGSAKSNVGHLDRAAGVTGLIKTALALHHEEIPPTLHFERPNPQLARSAGRLDVVTSLRPWPRGARPRRAGVSAFGMGGTNAHVVVEEAPAPDTSGTGTAPREQRLLVWSARTADAADQVTDRLRDLVGSGAPTGDADRLDDIAYSLQTGRAVFEHRRAAVVTSSEDAARALGEDAPHRVLSRREAARRRASFLLAGVGEHYQGLVGGLYRGERVFREAVDACAEVFRDRLGTDPVELFLGHRERGAPGLAGLLGRTDETNDTAGSDATEVVQPAMFAVDYALGRLLMSWGVTPRMLLGYSVGEFAAACLAGSLTLPEAASLTAFRAQLIAGLPAGAMTAVPLSVAELGDRFGPLDGTGVDVAAVNGPGFTVLSGPADAVGAFSARLTAEGVPARALRATHGFHSATLRPAAAELTAWARSELAPKAPRIPYLSNVTGAPVTEEQLRDPGYWAEHMCRTVRFSDMLTHLLADGDDVLLELGPGQSLGSMARNHPACARERWPLLLPTLPAQADPATDQAVLTEALGRMWLAGVDVDWQAYHEGRAPRKVSVPPYPFQRERYWIDPAPTVATAVPTATAPADGPAEPERDERSGDGLFVPRWTPRPLTTGPDGVRTGPLWILADDRGVADALAERLTADGHTPVLVRPTGRTGPGHQVGPGDQDDYRRLLETAGAPGTVVHLWGLDSDLADPAHTRETGFDALRALTAAFGDAGLTTSLLVVTDSARAARDDDRPVPERATVLGPCLVAPQEYPALQVRTVDVVRADGTPEALAAALHTELGGNDRAVALRAGTRLVLDHVPADGQDAPDPVLPSRGGVCLITGGLGPVGLLIAEHLGRTHGVKLVLTGRGALPPRAAWERVEDPALRARVGGLRRLADLGVEADAVTADVTDEQQLRALVTGIVERHGRLDGVLHLAAVTDPTTLSPLSGLGPRERDAHFHAKTDGALVLERVLADVPVGFCLLFSSMSAVLGGIGFGSYAAANSFLDALVHRHREDTTRWLSVNWDTWPSTAAALTEAAPYGGSLARYSLTEATALAALDAVLTRPLPRTVVSAGDLPARLDEWVERRSAPAPARPADRRFPRPDLAQQYVPPSGDTQRRLAGLWGELLGVDGVGARDNFAELGGTSLMVLQLVKRVREEFGATVSPVTLFEAPTVHALARVIDGAAAPTAPPRTRPGPHGAPAAAPEPGGAPPAAAPAAGRVAPIAVIGLTGRFPGAADLDAFWHNLSNGVESVSWFAEEDLLASGVPPERLRDPDYVPARPVLADIRSFDAGFFGYSPRDAAHTDPQHRLFLECCWEALEHGGYGARTGRGRVGVFGGANFSTYLMLQAGRLTDGVEADVYGAIIGNDKDSLTTDVSYRLGLTGPSMSVQTFCSTSLVALHLACQSLRADECEMALAGGAGIHVPDRVGHQYLPGGMESPDGRVRAFDADAKGTLFGDGVGVVLLKRLDRALADGDTVHAVIRGSAVNNDGSLKVGYTAPSVVGQAAVVADAMAVAGVTAEDVGYVEAHGTGTPLGDPIEIAALTRAFGATERRQYCPVGSVKTNIGHLGAAAGASGLIKTVLSLRNGTIPPSLNFTEPNPEIDFTASPFYVNTAPAPWRAAEGRRRVAGVNSLGMGGTNVHVILEEPPEPTPRDKDTTGRRYEILPLSARTGAAADQAVARLRAHLRGAERPPCPLDVAYTLQAGRERFEHRRVLVTGSLDSLRAPADHEVEGLMRRADPASGRPVDFLFAGVGEQYPGMVGELYRREPEFRAALDECAAHLGDPLGADLVGLLTAPRGRPRDDGDALAALLGRAPAAADEAAAELARTELAQPAAFVTDYALARLLMSWGVRPATMLGYSVGEYVAACLAGVLDLPDALRLVAFRARLIAGLPAGAMLAVPLSPGQLAARFGAHTDLGLDVSVVNGPELTVLGGPRDIVDDFAARLDRAGVPGRKLATTHAFHTRMLAPAGDELTAWAAAELRPRAPERPYVSNLTGALVTHDLVADPAYWARHMCGTVRFSEGLAHLLADPDPVLLELGPGQSLGAMARVHPGCARDRWPLVVPTLPSAAEARPDDEVAAEAVARLWLAGADVDWDAYQHGRAPRRTPLPTYAFQREEYWLDPAPARPAPAPASPAAVPAQVSLDDVKRAPLPLLPEDKWLHTLVWRQTAPRPGGLPASRWLVLTDDGPADEVCAPLARRLTAAGGSVVLARPDADAAELAGADGEFRIRPGSGPQFRELMRRLRDEGGLPERVVHLWPLGLPAGDGPSPGRREVEEALVHGTDTLVALATAAADVGAEKWSLDVVVHGTRQVTGSERLRPELSTVSGPVRGIPLEYPEVSCRLIDVEPVSSADAEALAGRIAAELGDGEREPVVALRNGRRWLPDYETLPDSGATPDSGAARGPRDGGVYLITGGLGGIGLALAERLARDCDAARIVLFGRTGLPPRDTWEAALADPAAGAEVRRRLSGVLRLEELGAEVAVVTGDVSVPEDTARAVRTALDRFGALHGVLHAAGLPGIGLMQFKTTAEMRKVMAPKAGGTLALEEALDGVPLDFLVLFSSITSATGGGPGQVDYSSANAFLDCYAEAAAARDGRRRTVAIGWGEWEWNAWEAGLSGYDAEVQEFFRTNRQRFGIGFDAGWRLVLRALAQDQPYVVANTQDFAEMERLSRHFTVDLVGGRGPAADAAVRHPRPDLVTAFVPPSGRTQRVIAEVWADLLGLRELGVDDNFFDLGGSSLIGMEVMARIRRRLSVDELAPHLLYEAPTVARLARLLAPDEERAARPRAAGRGHGGRHGRRPRPQRPSQAWSAARQDPGDGGLVNDDENRLAIVGMAGRFPGAGDPDALWANLTRGVGGIRDITQEELAAARVAPALQADPRYVRRGAPLADTELFDASFFGYSPREAEVADPQHRMFLECCWEALEGAGYRPNATPDKVGVFGGVAPSHYGLRHVLARPEVMSTITLEQYGMGTTSDSLCTLVAYKLGLTGPVVGVQTNCSTSLVAVHLAAQSLLTYDCDVALAGGAAIFDPVPTGYRFEEGSITSPDGVVRSFDADADGTVMGNGVAVVVLKRLADARRAGDHIWAVVLGSAINNDGAARAGFSAPGVDGQSAVISYALAVAEVAPDTVGYVECHATGTRLGDSIELAAVDRAYPAVPATPRVLSSLKPDTGHLDRASGAAGLIKAALALHHKVLPATRGFRTPNAALAGDRFTVLTEDRAWPSAAHPRRAGVNSFGAGGTNVHMVLEEAPPSPAAAPVPGPHLLVLSARTRPALDAAVRRLSDRLRGTPPDEPRLADVAYTLQQSRTGFPYRTAVVCADARDAVRALADPERRLTAGPVTPSGAAFASADPRLAAEHWLAGEDVDWAALHDGPRRRVPLPTYPFERGRYFLAPVAGSGGAGGATGLPGAAAGAAPAGGRIPDVADWFSCPSWRSEPLPRGAVAARVRERGPWWVVASDGPGFAAARRLADLGADVTLLRPAGPTGEPVDAPGIRVVDITADARPDFAHAVAERGRPRSVLHALGLETAPDGGPEHRFAAAQRRGFHSVLALVGALGEDAEPGPVDLLLCTGGAAEVTGGDLRRPEQATLAGLQPVINQEFGDITCRLLDVDPDDWSRTEGGPAVLADELLAEICADGPADPAALRGTLRWVRSFVPVRVEPVADVTRTVPRGATVLITGGLGTVGSVLAEHFAASRSCDLVLTTRTPLPPEDTWQDWLDGHPADDPTATRIRTVRGLRAGGAAVLVIAADVASRQDMRGALAAARDRFGPLDAVVHAAGAQGREHFGFAPGLSREVCETHFRAKVTGLRVLDELLAADEAPVRVTMSSLAAVLGGVAYGPYAAANAAMDAYARVLGDGRWLPVNWDTWNLGEDPHGDLGVTMKDYFYDAAEGCDVLERCLSVAHRVRQLTISTGPLEQRFDQWTRLNRPDPEPPRTRYPRPELPVLFEAPGSADEEAIAEIWSDILGVDGVGVNDDFFQLGGHSLAAVRMMTRIRTRFGGFPAQVLIENPTVRSFSKALTARN
ncbi:type I polyketide synthase [Streptomyces sp. MNP-20]|uniref:type I polyketide synthase n=1 Tax=Streptomyces sp. MNP-20 TaxID=2721165 RepID=UPI001555536B|nr:type I polyketide synthase [Streptomyces sp. MNP-20]